MVATPPESRRSAQPAVDRIFLLANENTMTTARSRACSSEGAAAPGHGGGVFSGQGSGHPVSVRPLARVRERGRALTLEGWIDAVPPADLEAPL